MKILNYPQLFSGLSVEIDLAKYSSPPWEHSEYKGIPMQYRYHPVILDLIHGLRLKVRYRGKSKPELGYRRNPSYVPERYADTFALYPRE